MSIQLAVVSAFMRAVGNAVVDNGIANESIRVLTNLGASLIDRGSEAENELQLLTEQIKQMVVEQREPTQAEWDAMSARSDAAHSAIQAWRPSA